MLLTTMVAPANNCRAQTPKFNRHTLLSVAIFLSIHYCNPPISITTLSNEPLLHVFFLFEALLNARL